MANKDSNLFSNIGGRLTEEQERIRKMQKYARKYWIETEDSENSEVEDSEEEEAYKVVTVLASDEQPFKEVPQPSTSGYLPEQITALKEYATVMHEKDKLQQELTNRFISGDLTFTEFNDMMEKARTEDNVEQMSNTVEQMDISEEEEEEEEDIKIKCEEDYEEEEEQEMELSEDNDDAKDADYNPAKPSKPPAPKRKRGKRKPKRERITNTNEFEEFSEELQSFKRNKGRRRNKRTSLPFDLQGLVGEANLRFARGEYEDAMKMCMEVIRLAPTFPEAFQTMGMIYEEMGEMDKSLQFALIAAHLNRNDAEEWCRLAEMSLERNDIKQAIACYKNAIRADPKNLDLMWAQCKLYENTGDKKRALDQMVHILKCLKPEEGDIGLQVARDITKSYYDSNQIEHAMAIMNKAFVKFPKHITSEDVNLLLELQMKQKLYEPSLKILCENCGITFDPPLPPLAHQPTENNDETKQDPSTAPSIEIVSLILQTKSCTIPEVLPIDLTCKLLVCLIHVKACHLIQDILNTLMQENPEEMGDLFLDVAEAFMDVQMHKEAIPILVSLAASEKFNLAAVWLRYGECLNALGQLEESIRAYKQVVKLAPTHTSARMTLSSLLQQVGQSEEALTVLGANSEDLSLEMEPQLLIQRSLLLYSRGLFDEFLEAAKLLHQTHVAVYNPYDPNYKSLVLSSNVRGIKEFFKDQEDNGKVIPHIDESVNPDNIWDVFVKMCHKLFELGRYGELEHMTKTAFTSTVFHNFDDKYTECRYYRMLACFMNKNYEHAYVLIKPLICKDVNNGKLWNIFNQIMFSLQDLRHSRFCIRLMLKHHDHPFLGMMNGHCALVSGSYKHALGEYMQIFRIRPNDPLVTLSIALVFIHLACQRFFYKKHSLVVQATAFLNRYLSLRGETQEAFYNLGRAMQQISLNHAAVHYYKKALACEPAIPTTPDCDYFDLRREIAFNLSLIYAASDNQALARYYVNKYGTM